MQHFGRSIAAPNSACTCSTRGTLIDEVAHAEAAATVARLGREWSERPVGRPASYTAVSVTPTSWEFYQGGGGDLGYVQHDRFLYVADAVEDPGATDGSARQVRLVGRLQA